MQPPARISVVHRRQDGGRHALWRGRLFFGLDLPKVCKIFKLGKVMTLYLVLHFANPTYFRSHLNFALVYFDSFSSMVAWASTTFR